MSRGYRMGQSRSSFVIILPFGSTSGTELAVQEMLRLKAAGGIKVIVERRTSP